MLKFIIVAIIGLYVGYYVVRCLYLLSIKAFLKIKIFIRRRQSIKTQKRLYPNISPGIYPDSYYLKDW